MDEQQMTTPYKSPLCATLADLPETELVPAKYLTGGSIGAQIAYGQESSIMTATRQPGYHTKPHTHAAEQMNYVLSGELFIFVGDDGFLAHEGDIFRIPKDAVHWSHVSGTGPCVLLEVHAPSLIGDPGVIDTATPLLTDEEKRDMSSIQKIESIWPDDIDRDAIEARVMKRLGY